MELDRVVYMSPDFIVFPDRICYRKEGVPSKRLVDNVIKVCKITPEGEPTIACHWELKIKEINGDGKLI